MTILSPYHSEARESESRCPDQFSNTFPTATIMGASVYAGFAAVPLSNCYGHVFSVPGLEFGLGADLPYFYPSSLLK
jgi:hypothetical protein